MKPSISGRRIRSCMPIQAPKEKPAIQQLRASGLIEGALAAPDAAEVEAEHREIAVHEGVVDLIDDLVVHRPAELRVRVQDDGERRVLLPRRVVSPLDAPGRADENDFRHGLNLGRWTRGAGEPGWPATARLTARAGARNYLEPF